MHVAIQMHRKQKYNTCPHCDTRKEIPQAYVEHLFRGPLYYINQNLNKLRDLQGQIEYQNNGPDKAVPTFINQ